MDPQFDGTSPPGRGSEACQSTQIFMPLELQPRMDPFERLLWWLFAGSVGAQSRIDIVFALKEQPRNAQQLSELLGLDYTTVRHHLSVLERNRILLTEGDKYGRVYFLSETMDTHWPQLEAILHKTKLSRRGSK
jgi:DNA-binding transcriptional ArsR family regulator